jgi:hypothetical protein
METTLIVEPVQNSAAWIAGWHDQHTHHHRELDAGQGLISTSLGDASAGVFRHQ